MSNNKDDSLSCSVANCFQEILFCYLSFYVKSIIGILRLFFKFLAINVKLKLITLLTWSAIDKISQEQSFIGIETKGNHSIQSLLNIWRSF